MANEISVGFSPANARRVAKAVRRVERWPSYGDVERRPGSPPEPRGVRFKNTSGSSCPLGALMKVTGTLSDYSQDDTHIIAKPDSTLQREYLVNIDDEIEDGGFGTGHWLAESNFFLVEPGSSPGTGDSYGAVSGQWYAQKNRPGFIVTNTARFDDTGLVKGRQEILNWLPGKANAQIAKGGTGDFSVWMRNKTTGAWEDSGFDLVAVRALAAIVLATPKFSSVSFSSGEWLAAPWEC